MLPESGPHTPLPTGAEERQVESEEQGEPGCHAGEHQSLIVCNCNLKNVEYRFGGQATVHLISDSQCNFLLGGSGLGLCW